LKSEVSDPNLQRPQGTTPRIATFRKHEHHATAFEHLINGSQSNLIELTFFRRDRKDPDQWEEAPLPSPIEDGFTLGHGVDHRRFRKERNDECRIEPGLVIGRNDERGLRDVLLAGDRDSEKRLYDPPDEPNQKSVEPGRVLRRGMDERVERTLDQRPIFGTSVATIRRGGRC
jgi:hypothetical protein